MNQNIGGRTRRRGGEGRGRALAPAASILAMDATPGAAHSTALTVLKRCIYLMLALAALLLFPSTPANPSDQPRPVPPVHRRAVPPPPSPAAATTAPLVGAAPQDSLFYASSRPRSASLRRMVPPSLSAIEALNWQWEHGSPRDRLAEGGVLMSLFDPLSEPLRPWLPCASRFCRARRDRKTASLVNAKRPALYPHGCGGFVLRSRHVSPLCAYYSDGGHSRAARSFAPAVDQHSRVTLLGGSDRILCQPGARTRNQKTALTDEAGRCLPGCGPVWCQSAEPLVECHAGCGRRPSRPTCHHTRR